MRILIASDTFPPHINGAARFAERLGQGLVRRGHEVHQIAPSTNLHSYAETVEGVVIHRVRSYPFTPIEAFRWVAPWDSFPEIARIVGEVRPDVVHLQCNGTVGRAAGYHATRQGIPLVATNHVMPENLMKQLPIPRAFQNIATEAIFRDMRHVFKQAQVLTAPTPRAVAMLEKSAKLVGGLAVSCGVDTAVYAAAAEAAPAHDVPVILYVGRLDPEKRIRELVEAVAGLPSDVPYRLEIIGDGIEHAHLVKLAAAKGLGPDKVKFFGFVSEEELLAAYGRCDIFCMPGIAELQSLVTLEAMSAGKPVVAANAMALPHLVHPGDNGWLYTPGDVAELRGHLQTLLTSPDLRRRMGAESQRIVAKHGVDGTLQKYETLYERAISAVKGA
ncbi:MAG: glycosyltransferase [Propionibacteriaceae bacterium]